MTKWLGDRMTGSFADDWPYGIFYFLDTLRFSWTSAVKECFCFLFFSFCDGKECLTWANVLITNILTEGLAVWRHILHLPATGGRPTPAVPVQAPWLAGCLHSNHSRVLPFLTSGCSQPANLIQFDTWIIYRVSHNWVLTLFCLFSRLPVLIQRFILPFFNSPGDDDSKTHLTFLPTSKIDQVTEQNVRQTGFRYYYFGTYKVYLNCI